MAEIGGGQVAAGSVDANFIEPEQVSVELRMDRIPKVLGIKMTQKRVREILGKHQPRQLDPAMERELLDYRDAVRKRSMADFEAAEWED